MNTLPCKIDRLPTLLTVNSVLQSAMWLNMFPRKEGVSNTISPHGIIRGRQLDYKVHCRLPFGAYCEVHDEPSPSNTSKSRTTGAIALGPNGNLQGGYFFMSLRTWKKLSRRSWTELPAIDKIIRKVEERYMLA